MKNDETKKYHPTEEIAEAARMALRTDGDTFWQEVETRLEEYDPKIEPRRVRE